MLDETKSRQESGQPTELRLVEGHTYFSVTRAMRTECTVRTISRLPHLGKKAPQCYEYLGRTLALLDQIACCAWGCPGTEDGHLPHRLIGRGVSDGSAGIELALNGHYDQSLAAARGVGEIANLLWLFDIDPEAFADWKTLESRERWRKYRPAQVRKRIRDLQQPLLVDEPNYALLSERGIHVLPTTSPNTIGLNHRPSLGGVYREEALVVCLNEVAWAIGVLSLPTVQLMGPASDGRVVLETARTLLGNVGGMRLTKVDEYLNETVLDSLAFSDLESQGN